MPIKVGIVPGKIVNIELEEGVLLTIAQLVERQFPGEQGYELRLNGQPAQPTDELRDGDVVTLLKAIDGN